MSNDHNNLREEVWSDYKKIKKRHPLYVDIVDVRSQNHRDKFAEIVNPYITDETVMLDIGCGFADHLIKYFRSAKRVYGIDFNKRMVEEAKNETKNIPRITIMLMDARDLVFEDDLFHIVTSVFNPMDSKSTQEVHRVLRTEGYYIRTYHGGDFVYYQGRMLKRPQDILGRGAYFDRQNGELLSEEVSQIKDSGFYLPDYNIDSYQGTRVFKNMSDLVAHIRNSGHFRFFEPFTPLNDDEIEELYRHESEFRISYNDSDAFALPFSSFLIIAQKV